MPPLLAAIGVALLVAVLLMHAWLFRRALERSGSRSAMGWYASMAAKRDFSSYWWLLSRSIGVGFAAVALFVVAQAWLG